VAEKNVGRLYNYVAKVGFTNSTILTNYFARQVDCSTGCQVDAWDCLMDWLICHIARYCEVNPAHSEASSQEGINANALDSVQQ